MAHNSVEGEPIIACVGWYFNFASCFNVVAASSAVDPILCYTMSGFKDCSCSRIDSASSDETSTGCCQDSDYSNWLHFIADADAEMNLFE